MKMKVAVIGGSGFIGTRLIELLVSEHSVVNIDKKMSEEFPNITKICDVRDCERLTSYLVGVEVIINLAAEHADNVTPKSLYYDVNVVGAKNIVEAAVKNNIKRILFTSSVALYGLDKDCSLETDEVEPFNEYGSSKLKAEQVFLEWSRAGGNTVEIVRPVVIFGESNRGNVYNLLKQIYVGPFFMIGNGMNRKSMGYVGNISAYLKDAVTNIKDTVFIVNYSDKPDLTMDELVGFVVELIPGRARVLKIPYSVGVVGGILFDLFSFITKRKYSISLIRVKKFCSNTVVNADKLKDTGFNKPFTLKEGLRRTIKHGFSIK